MLSANYVTIPAIQKNKFGKMSILLKVEVLTFKLDKLCFANALHSKSFSIIYYPFPLINNRVTSSAKGDTID